MSTNQGQIQTPQAPTLQGMRVAVARAPEDAEEMTARLHHFGAEVFYYPSIDILPLSDNGEFDAALHEAAAGKFDWLVLNDADTVIVVAERLRQLGIDPRTLLETKVATIGCMTEQNTQNYLGLHSSFAPEVYDPKTVAAALRLDDSDRVFLPQSSITRMSLAKCLVDTGADVVAANAYRTVIGHGGDPVPVMLWEGKIDAVAFTYPTEIHYFAKRLKHEGGTLAMLDDVLVACIGPITSETARNFGLKVAVQPEDHTYQGLVDAMAAYVTARR